jgi:hypothetical protein
MAKHFYSVQVGNKLNSLEQICIRRLASLVKPPDTHTMVTLNEIVEGVVQNNAIPTDKYQSHDLHCQIWQTRFGELWERCRETIAKDYFRRPYAPRCMSAFLRLFVCYLDPDAFYVDNDVYFRHLPEDSMYEPGKPYFGDHKAGLVNHHVIYANGRRDFFENMLVMFDAMSDFIRQGAPCRYLSAPPTKRQVELIPHSFFYHKGSTFS